MTEPEPLILLVHRIPYPPNKGDKIRSYHLLRYLARHYRVYLGAFVDDAADLEHSALLREWCSDVHVEMLPPGRSRLRMMRGLLTGVPLSVACYSSPTMRGWLRQVVRTTGARRLVGFSAAMAQYADELAGDARRVLDMVDVDSDKWRQYAQRRRGPMALIYRLEAARLFGWECAAARSHDAVMLVSDAEAELFRDRLPDGHDRVVAISNGVDCHYFTPGGVHENPYPPGTRALVFTGAMDYWPNVDAVTWFADAILPGIVREHPEVVFYIVGARPSSPVRALDQRENIRVVGATPDMRPWLAHASAVVAPLRVARGIQNKVLEGFAMARPVVATPMALEGLELEGDYALQGEDATAFVAMTCRLLAEGDSDGTGERMREWVHAHYDWDQRLAPVRALVEGAYAAPQPEARTRMAVS